MMRWFLDPLAYILIAAGVVTLALGDYSDAAGVIVVVPINGVVVSFRSTGRSGRSWPFASGTHVPADVALIEAEGLRVGEAALTGESEAVAAMSASGRTVRWPLVRSSGSMRWYWNGDFFGVVESM